MLPDSIQGITKAPNNNSLYTLWTKYGKYSEGPLLFEGRSLSEQTRKELNFVVSEDDYRQALDDICNFATNKALPPPLHDFSFGGFKNPFLNTEQSGMIGAVTLLGHPGIGKSLWLYIVLVLRILAGRPTIYHFGPDICYVFDADGLYEVNFGNTGLQSSGHWQFNNAISQQDWCLVDSNQTVVSVPPFLASLPIFLVQSASPRSERIEWSKKYNHVHITYCMKNWSLSELIVGRTLQKTNEPCSEAELEIFYSRYASSARMAYAYAHLFLDVYDTKVRSEIAKLAFDTISIVLSTAGSLGTAEGVSHHILLVSPQNNRREHLITIPTRYIYKLLRDQLHITTLQEAAMLYQIFVRNSYIKAPAGYILDDVHDLFFDEEQGGTCKHAFQVPDGALVTTARRSLPETATFVPLTRRRYFIGQNIILENGYYQPAPGQATFDSFIYDEASLTATMLQITVATQHDVTAKGMEWLRNQGVREFRLVAVALLETSLDLMIPNTLVLLITEAYSLMLEAIIQLMCYLFWNRWLLGFLFPGPSDVHCHRHM
ncbi:hypothetical protein PILCRDRAFT_1716 [Piloderma croceum F 1598]|uniref:Uncharacterized protein n=1 Tax=Piloderma croceum (strain F 1598) TaxID=765440 RepID=A0A0C3BV25_PILCF|nr:hypothetical protein PILCRDRAFT_1716 [Piloderma croceum F 1598]